MISLNIRASIKYTQHLNLRQEQEWSSLLTLNTTASVSIGCVLLLQRHLDTCIRYASALNIFISVHSPLRQHVKLLY